ncbi:SAVED domain-containing protein [Peribacillus deserti]|uniref:HNH endonuclease n=1 Tax=Peribacillus deserti TaxID=673318 RepID=A0A2N5M4Q1_9BACI|nr:SAVED domain-containing protein [Peribacillus deserti]PLT29315.1 HNH endonuclease [Peribacillus deserti]
MSRDPFKLSTVDDRDLWVRSGGLCARCKRALILDDIEKKVNIGEKAHIIGKGTGKNAPRREFAEEFGFNEENIDSLDNLMLMCSPCHHTIDTNVEAYPPQLLFDMKNQHEGWVRSRLSQNNKAIAVIHKRKNSIPFDSILLTDEIDMAILDAVSFQDEFTDFTSTGWVQAKKDNEDFFKKVVQAKVEYPGTKLCIFSLSPIPLLIHFGKLISETIPIVIYQFDRDSQKWCLEDTNGKVTHKKINVLISDKVCRSLVVTVQVSGTIGEEEVKEAVGTPYHQLDISVEKPELNAVLYNHDITAIRQVFRKHLYNLQDLYDYKEIHLFYYGPAGLAVEIGRTINDTMLPIIHLYQYSDRNEQKYSRAISI